MYRILIRPLLFSIDPEHVHHLIIYLLKLFLKFSFINLIVRKFYGVSDKRLERELLGLRFKNPVGLAAGFDKNAEVFDEISSFGFSFIEIGTVTPKPQQGNEKPRLFRLKNDNALINRMGFNNSGAELVAIKLKKRPKGLIIGGNIGKNTLTPNNEAVSDYESCFRYLYDYVDYFVVNVSCPNIADLYELQDEASLTAILTRLGQIRGEQAVKKSILLKISPDLDFVQINGMIKIVAETGMEGFVISNTTTKRERLITPDKEVKEIGRGGLSGSPIKDRSTEIIRYVAQKASEKVIIGVGGIMSPADALEKINAGASLIQIYTGFIYEGPGLVKRINRSIIKNEGTKY